MSTPDPPPCAPGPKTATTEGLTFSMTATRSASALSTGLPCWAWRTPQPSATAAPARRTVFRACRMEVSLGGRSPGRERPEHLLTHLRVRQRRVVVQVEEIPRADDDAQA